MNEKDVNAYTLNDLGWDRVPTWIEDKGLLELMSLKGRVAVITGAGGPCLGRALCLRLASLGADIALVGRHAENIHTVAKEVEEKWHVKTGCFVADLTDFDAVSRMFQDVHKQFGHIDILINNANSSAGGPFHTLTDDVIKAAIDGPYRSVVNCCRHVCDYMIPQGYGRIINISSESSARAKNVNLAVYASSKAAVNGLTRSLAGELAPYGILVNGVAPGVMFKKSLRDMFEHPTEKNLGIRKSMVYSTQDTILKRVSIPEEVANTVAFLCTDATSFIVGQTIMNGGGAVV